MQSSSIGGKVRHKDKVGPDQGRIIFGSSDLDVDFPGESTREDELLRSEISVDLKRDIWVFILKKPKDAASKGIFDLLLRFLLKSEVNIVLEEETYEEVMNEPIEFEVGSQVKILDEEAKRTLDFLILLGGDGTILRASSFFVEIPMPPALTFKLGTFNFISIFRPEEAIARVTAVLQLVSHQKKIPFKPLMRLRAEISSKEKKHVFTALNEILIDRGSRVQAVSLDIDIKGQRLANVTGSGVIISTPTGSTAFSLSAGGSILHPKVYYLFSSMLA
eukprot:TRINITY_DN5023_c0_g2_i1.p1 TRINITY_DN5023_c0_g2~~TRINITY_DN5023_c0_g2_i1.p1  ORF type:complete len:276 (+),score=25.09 TRINITY_DN5023_c0_g2_i1:150-977(+)